MMVVLYQDRQEAKDLNIKMGEPYFKVKDLVKKNNSRSIFFKLCIIWRYF